MQRNERRRRMFALVEAYQRGEVSRKEFCSRHRVALSTFGWWQHRYRMAREKRTNAETSDGAGFIRLMAAAPQPASFELCFADGTILRCPAGIADERLVSILRQLRDGQLCSG